MITDQQELLDKLHTMRLAGAEQGKDETVMTHLFAIIFDADISACDMTAARLAREYAVLYGPVAESALSNGRKLARYVTVDAALLRRWR